VENTAKWHDMNKLIIILFLIIPFFAISQETISITYGNKIRLGRMAENYEFEIQHLDSILSVKKMEINQFVFHKPGIYKVKTKEIIEKKYFEKKIESVEKPSLPPFFVVVVDSIKMDLLPHTIRMNHPFVVNHDMTYVLLIIDCEIKNYYKNPLNLNAKKLKFKTAGIGAEIEGELFKIEKTDSKDIYSLTYLLKGRLNNQGYIQLDFEKLNGEITSIGWREEIR
jgi:hypothetical protein